MAQRQTTPRPSTTPSPTHRDQQTFLEHLHELRRRLFVVIVAICIGSSLGYTFHDQLIRMLLAPLGGEKLIYLTPGGGFDFIFRISLYSGILLAIPVIMYELYRYLVPVMERPQTKRFTAFLLILACLLAVAGVAFGYFVALPAALTFLTGFAGNYVQAELTASSYLNFVTVYSLGLAAIFQLPIILLFINAANGPLKPSQLLGSERYVILGAFIAAALITPTPDVVNQTIMAAPIVAVYQIGVIMVWLQNRQRKQPVFRPTANDYETKRFQLAPPEPRIVMPVRRTVPPVVANPVSAMPARPHRAPQQHTPARRAMDIMPAPARMTRVPRPMPRATPTQQCRTVTIDGVFIRTRPNQKSIDNAGQRGISFI